MSPENEFIIVRKALELEARLVLFKKTSIGLDIVEMPGLKTNIDQAKQFAEIIYEANSQTKYATRFKVSL